MIDHVAQAARVLRAVLRSPLCPSGPQAAVQLSTQLTAALNEQGLVDRFVTHPHHRIVCELDPQAAGDLLERPEVLQPFGDLRRQGRRVEFGGLRALGLMLSSLVCSPRPIFSSASISLDPPKHPGDLTGLAFQAGG